MRAAPFAQIVDETSNTPTTSDRSVVSLGVAPYIADSTKRVRKSKHSATGPASWWTDGPAVQSLYQELIESRNIRSPPPAKDDPFGTAFGFPYWTIRKSKRFVLHELRYRRLTNRQMLARLVPADGHPSLDYEFCKSLLRTGHPIGCTTPSSGCSLRRCYRACAVFSPRINLFVPRKLSLPAVPASFFTDS